MVNVNSKLIEVLLLENRMSDSRRGFLKSMLGAGTALILPNQERKVITAADIVRPIEVPSQPLDMDGYYLIPKSAVRSFNLDIEQPIMEYESFRYNKCFGPVGPPIITFKIEGVMPPGIQIKASRKRRSLIAPDGIELLSIA